ncbi:iron ABC transporter ATP-binding protein FetA [Escherichia coli]|nr:iron ABC transporter ATP-binding protein FetA [Escherichia coli]
MRRFLITSIFSLCAGEFKLITGPSGCGKSTLLKIVASLISPTSGTLLFEGEDVSTLKPEIYRQQVSYCAQTPTLFGDTVYDNLIFPWQIRNQQPDPAIFSRFSRTLRLTGHHFDEEYRRAIWWGKKQRISLIRNLQFMPKVLLLDEITSALDESNKHNVNEMIHRYVREQNIAVLWVTHDKDEINHADKVITLQPHAGEMQEARYELA